MAWKATLIEELTGNLKTFGLFFLWVLLMIVMHGLLWVGIMNNKTNHEDKPVRIAKE
jgi:hypothetical protein